MKTIHKLQPSELVITNSLFIGLSWLLTMIAGWWLPLEASESSFADLKIAADRGDAVAQEKLGDAYKGRTLRFNSAN